MSGMLDAALKYAERYSFDLLPAPPTGEKKPICLGGRDFSNATHNSDKIRQHWKQHPDANIIRRVFGTIVLDIESVEGHPRAAEKAMLEGKPFGIDALQKLERELGQLPKTLLYQTWSGGLQITYTRPNIDKKLKRELAPGVELKYNGIVMLPPSIREGKRYKILDDCNITGLPEKWAEYCIAEIQEPDREDWDRVRNRSGLSICEKNTIDLRDVMTLPADAKKVAGGYLIKHPIHGAEGDGNLYVNVDENLWCCYHSGCDNSGGDPITWVAVREGFIRCDEAHGSLVPEVFKRCMKVLEREGLVKVLYSDDFRGKLIEEQKSHLARLGLGVELKTEGKR
jgi:hypothetical protein